MTRNRGHMPAEAEGKRIRGRLRSGTAFSGWPADGRGACRWSLTNSPFDIEFYEVIA